MTDLGKGACLVMLSALLLAGCQTVGSTGADGTPATAGAGNGGSGDAATRVSRESYHLFFDQGDHMEELLTAPDGHLAAARLYGEQREFFDDPESRPAHQPLLESVAARVNAEMAPELEAAASWIEAETWPPPEAAWPEARRQLQAARAALADYNDLALLRDETFRAAAADRLGAARRAAVAALKAHAAAAFRSYEHAADRNFFTAYPIDVDAGELFGDPTDLAVALSGRTAEQLERFAAAYDASTFGQEAWQAVSDRYVAVRRRALAAAGGDELEAAVRALTEAKTIGFTPSGKDGPGITFVQVTSRTLLREGAIDFPASVDQDISIAVSKANLEEALNGGGETASDYLILFDVALAKAQRRVSGLKPKRSTRLVGYKEVPNPERQTIQNQISQAQLEMQTARMSQSMAANSYCPDVGCQLGKLFSALSHKETADAAMERLAALNGQLAATPTVLEKPVYADYEFSAATVRARKVMTVHYYVVDRRKRRYFKSTFDVLEQQRFEVAYNLDDNDPGRETHLADHDTEQDVEEWEKAPSVIRISALLDHYLRNREASRPLPPTAALLREMVKDKNLALARHAEETYEASTQNDPRFDSVVQVFTGSRSMGTGFYVRPDIVMTNYHVVEELTYAELGLHGGRTTFGKVVARDPRLDLALIKVEARGKPARFHERNRIDLGSTVDVIGHPQGFDFSISRGVVSAVREERSVNIAGTKPVLLVQIDASISGGNSGGPVFMGDKVVSVVSWTWIKDSSQNLNFTIHHSEAEAFLRQHLEPGS